MKKALLFMVCVLGCGGENTPDAGSSGPSIYVSRVVEVTFGVNSGFGREGLPGIVMGPPRGGGEFQGSTDVLSLGTGGSITVELAVDVVDGAGADFIVFENAFRVQNTQLFFREPGQVSVSADGITFTAFPCAFEALPYTGCAGLKPVFSKGDGEIPATDVEHAGGDAFDLADLGIMRARFIRIEDHSAPAAADTAGFDLDAVVVVNAGE